MKKVLGYLGAFLAGVGAALAALFWILYGRDSSAITRRAEQKELENEIKADGEAKREETKKAIMDASADDAVASLPNPARTAIGRAEYDAILSARVRSRARAAELARRMADPNGGGSQGDRP